MAHRSKNVFEDMNLLLDTTFKQAVKSDDSDLVKRIFDYVPRDLYIASLILNDGDVSFVSDAIFSLWEKRADERGLHLDYTLHEVM